MSSLEARGVQRGVGQPLGSPPWSAIAVAGVSLVYNKRKSGRRYCTLGIERRHKVMVCIDLVDWRRVAPADGLLAEPVEGVVSHGGEHARLALADAEEQERETV